MNGKRCPTVENAPRSDLGGIAWHLATNGAGAWRDGRLDCGDLLRRPMARGLDRAALESVLIQIEAGALSGLRKRAGDDGDADV